MNSLSWLIYGAEVVANLKPMLFGLMPVGLIGGASAAVIGSLMVIDPLDDTMEKRGHEVRGYAKPLFVMALAGAFGSAILPSKDSVMLIVASQVGEQVINSKQAQELGGDAGALAADSLRLLRKYVNEQLDEKPEASN